MGAIVLVTCLGGAAFGQAVDQNLWVTNGIVNTVAHAGGKIYIGGSFSQVSPATGAGVPVDVATGAPLASFPKVVGTVFAIASDGAGGWYMGGIFTSVGGIPRNNLAHIASDWSVTDWDPNANNYVKAIAVSGSTVYVGGQFSSVGGDLRNGIAALDASTGLATAWNPNAIGNVHALAVSGSTVYAGGLFSVIGGQSRAYLAALNATTGLATSWAPNPNAKVETIVVGGTSLYVGGAFTTLSGLGGVTRNRIAGFDLSTGNLLSTWNPNANNEVHSLAVSGSLVYAGGYFSTIGGQTRSSIAALSTGGTGAATAWNPVSSGSVEAIAVSGSTVYAGGVFFNIGGANRNRVAALDATTGLATTWNPNANHTVYALGVSGSAVYVGGNLSGMGGVARQHLAALDAATGAATAWDPSPNGSVLTIAINGATVYAGGSFSLIGGQSRSHIAALDATTGAATGWNPNADSDVLALTVSGTKVYAGGSFGNIGGAARNGIAALDASTGTATGWNPNADGSVYAMAVSGSIMYVGGSFVAIGGQSRNNLAAVDLTSGLATSWNPNANNIVRTVVVGGSAIYVGGDFTTIAGQTRNRAAAFDPTNGASTAWNPNANDAVYGLAVNGPTVYAVGWFWSMGGQVRGGLAALDATSGAVKTWDPAYLGATSVAGYAYGVCVAASKVYVGGAFQGMGLLPQSNIAAITSVPAVLGILPASGGNAGPITATVSGVGFQSGASVLLTRAGLRGGIVGTQVTVDPSGQFLSVTFDISGAMGGLWDVVVTNPDLQKATLPNGFTIETVAAPQVRVSVLGPEPIRAGYPTAFDVVIENPGNVDAQVVPLWVTGIPVSATVTPDFVVSPPPQSPGEPDWGGVPPTFTSAGGQYLPLVIPRVPPGTTTRRIILNVPSSAPLFELGVAVAPSWGDDPVFRSCLSGGGVIANPTCMGTQLAAINAYLSSHPEVEAMSGTGIWAKVGWQCEGAGTLAAAIAKSEQVLDYLDGPIEQGTASPGCGDVLLPRWREVVVVNVVFSIDPNDKLGPQGPVSSQQSIPYSIRFENLSSSTAWARQVMVVDALATSLDLTSLSLESINLFGTVHLLPVPGSKQYTHDVDLGHDNLMVRVTASLDVPSRQLTWSFTTLDKATLQPPSNPLLGFLPPNQTPPQGEGSVLFTIRPSSQTPNGTIIQNSALISFDGVPQNTPPVSNTLDNVPPSSNVLTLGTPIGTPSFAVSWQGSGDGLKDYTIYVAQDAAPYQVWKQNTLSTSDTYTPQPGGHNYSFYSVARDMTGNIEPAPTAPDAQTYSTTAVEPGAARLSLLGGQPNPARGVLRVGFSLASREPATLELIDIAGRRVLRRQVGELGPGSHVVTLDSAPSLKTGLYFVRLLQEGRVLEKRVVLTK